MLKEINRSNWDYIHYLHEESGDHWLRVECSSRKSSAVTFDVIVRLTAVQVREASKDGDWVKHLLEVVRGKPEDFSDNGIRQQFNALK